MKYSEKHNIGYFTLPLWDKHETEMLHFFTTRKGGVSNAPYQSLNLGLGTDDNADHVIQNRQLLAQAFGISPMQFVFQNQVHGHKVRIIEKNMAGCGLFSRENAIQENDAMITREKGICLMVLGADCVPILLYDPVTKAIGAAHAGWKGTVQRIAQKTVETMITHFGCQPSDIQALLGPANDVSRYEVGPEVIDAAKNNIGHIELISRWNEKTQKHHFDTWEANSIVLQESGLRKENIHISHLSTADENHWFYSARRDKETGRFAGGIMLK